MSKYCVGDKVKVVANTVGHYFEDQENVTIEYVYPDGTYRAKSNDSEWWCVTDDDITHIATPSRFEIGKTYKTADQGNVTCVYIHPNGQALCLFDRHHDKLNSAYVWNADGTYDSALPSAAGPYRIVFEPVVTTHNHVVFAHGESRNTQYNLVDGKVDWDSFAVLK